ncbi:hypothetical protein, unlikely [Trypanosoma brucei gambiense DAL972]|uniref:Uncharacterized protein n=1 Tax=Trypanosoma brucei gambiense (strain MHOM/CI/86/DAL972) TaxID=679716 RepID=D0AA14_TRYB9|nr:hypothetical protein, unlikely [Trypanosoma brucei gambiense DAL972]CBH18515.1 hypothetical protein, unlikely [Trypanosoma brucei gambiense DAL972]|eukprot:XP_011780779.1 hypothetical protein, unlikely [Trypanosoma brucei gambiense DAL972]
MSLPSEIRTRQNATITLFTLDPISIPTIPLRFTSPLLLSQTLLRFFHNSFPFHLYTNNTQVIVFLLHLTRKRVRTTSYCFLQHFPVLYPRNLYNLGHIFFVYFVHVTCIPPMLDTRPARISFTFLSPAV